MIGLLGFFLLQQIVDCYFNKVNNALIMNIGFNYLLNLFIQDWINSNIMCSHNEYIISSIGYKSYDEDELWYHQES